MMDASPFRFGFTGTRKGMTADQKITFRILLCGWRPAEFHHGDCVGSDTQAHALVRAWAPATRIVIHPPFLSTARAYSRGDVVLPQASYLQRNHAIVDATDLLVAVSLTDHETAYTGTWATVRYARRTHKPCLIVWPNGTTTCDLPPSSTRPLDDA